MDLTKIAFLLFAAIAAGGLGMAALIAFKLRFPAFLGAAHGLGGLAALALLFAANLMNPDAPERAWWALGVLTAGLVGGLIFFRVLFRDHAPLWLVAGHGSVALFGLWLLYPVVFPA